ncbi:hypothetical protein GQX74_004057 [Glossina fuscipes]|nr:hypothetical protein GQX74_004057 [Glossina fuscipes]
MYFPDIHTYVDMIFAFSADVSEVELLDDDRPARDLHPVVLTVSPFCRTVNPLLLLLGDVSFKTETRSLSLTPPGFAKANLNIAIERYLFVYKRMNKVILLFPNAITILGSLCLDPSQYSLLARDLSKISHQQVLWNYDYL